MFSEISSSKDTDSGVLLQGLWVGRHSGLIVNACFLHYYKEYLLCVYIGMMRMVV